MKYVITMIVILCVAVSLFAAPKIVAPKPVYDYGTVLEKTIITNRFIIRNAGDETLIISKVRKSCGCTKAVFHPDNNQLPPGGQGYVEAIFNTRGKKNKSRSVISIYANDPNQEVLKLTFTGTVKPAYTISPRHLSFINLTPQSNVSGTFTVRCFDNDTFTINKTNMIIPSGLSVTSIKPNKEKTEYVISIAVDASKIKPPTGSSHHTIQLRTDRQKESRIDLSVYVVIQKKEEPKKK